MSKNINFLKRKKDYYDKIVDLYDKETVKIFGENKDGEIVYKRRKGVKRLAEKIGVPPSTLTRWYKGGRPAPSKKQKSKINGMHRRKVKGERIFSSEKRYSKTFTKHTFTRKNFFRKKNIGRLKKHQQFYFKCGLKIICSSITSSTGIYIINNHPIAHYDNKGYPKGYDNFYSLISAHINSFQSIVEFSFNYFSVTIVDL